VADLGVMHGGQASFPPLALSSFLPSLYPFYLPFSSFPLEVGHLKVGTPWVWVEPSRQTYFGAFEWLNDEEFPVICSPFEGRFHSIDVIAKCGHFL